MSENEQSGGLRALLDDIYAQHGAPSQADMDWAAERMGIEPADRGAPESGVSRGPARKP